MKAIADACTTDISNPICGFTTTLLSDVAVSGVTVDYFTNAPVQGGSLSTDGLTPQVR